MLLRVRGLGIEVRIADARVERIRSSRAYDTILRPLLRLVFRKRADQDGSSPVHLPTETFKQRIKKRPLRVEAAMTPEIRELVARIEDVDWYHVLELPHGISTPGSVDHRHQVDRYGLPVRMDGMRALDVASYDGFWAFEMEKRGAEVIAIDIETWSDYDIPLRGRKQALETGAGRRTDEGFRLARELLGSNVERQTVNVYDLSQELTGQFDLVLISDLLLHLRDPQRALESAFQVTGAGGQLILAEPYNPSLEEERERALSQFIGFVNYVWWLPASMTLKAMMMVAGYDPIEEIARFELESTLDAPIHKVVLRGLRPLRPKERRPTLA